MPLPLVIPTWLSGAPRKPGPGAGGCASVWSPETLSPLPELPPCRGFPPTLILRSAAVRSPEGLRVPAALEVHVAHTRPNSDVSSRSPCFANTAVLEVLPLPGRDLAPPHSKRTLPPPPRYPAWRPGLCPPPHLECRQSCVTLTMVSQAGELALLCLLLGLQGSLAAGRSGRRVPCKPRRKGCRATGIRTSHCPPHGGHGCCRRLPCGLHPGSQLRGAGWDAPLPLCSPGSRSASARDRVGTLW